MIRYSIILTFLILTNFVNGQVSSPTSYWAMEESSGDIVDLVSTNDGTASGDPVYQQAGKLGYCIAFDGDGDYFTMPDVAALQMYDQDFTFTAWVYADVLTGDDYRTVFGGESGAACFAVNTSTSAIVLREIGVNTSPDGPTISIEGWHFIVASFNSTETTNNLILGVDGSYSTVTYNNDFGLGASTNIIGRNSTGVSDYWNGDIDDCSIYKGIALTTNQLDSLYNSGTGCAYPFNCWEEEETTTAPPRYALNYNGITSRINYNNVRQYIDLDSETGDFTIYRTIDFENMTIGICDEDTIFKYFPDTISCIYHANDYLDILEDEINGESTQVLAIENDAAFNGFGMGLPLIANTLTDFDEMYLTYNIRFGVSYDQGQWAKMPGFAGGPDDPVMGPSCPDPGYGFIAKHLFASNKLVTYHYDQTPNTNRTNMGGSPADGTCPWAVGTYHYNGSVSISNNQWYNITIRLVMNTFTESNPNFDGIMETWIDGVMVFQLDELALMQDEGDDMKIDEFYITHFKNPETSPNDTAFFDNFNTWIPANDSISGYELHNPNSTMYTPAKIESLWWLILLLPFLFLNYKKK